MNMKTHNALSITLTGLYDTDSTYECVCIWIMLVPQWNVDKTNIELKFYVCRVFFISK